MASVLGASGGSVGAPDEDVSGGQDLRSHAQESNQMHACGLSVPATRAAAGAAAALNASD